MKTKTFYSNKDLTDFIENNDVVAQSIDIESNPKKYILSYRNLKMLKFRIKQIIWSTAQGVIEDEIIIKDLEINANEVYAVPFVKDFVLEKAEIEDTGDLLVYVID